MANNRNWHRAPEIYEFFDKLERSDEGPYSANAFGNAFSRAGYTTLREIRSLSLDELKGMEGFGAKKAVYAYEALHSKKKVKVKKITRVPA